MTPRQLFYEVPVESVSHEFWPLTDFVGEADIADIAQDEDADIELRYLKNIESDSRCWRLITVWFKLQPVMVIQEAGRGGLDHQKKFVVDTEVYRALVFHLRSKILAAGAVTVPIYPLNMPDDECLGMDDEDEDLTRFCGGKL